AGDIYLAMDTQSTNLTVAPTAAPGPYSSAYGGGVSDGFLAIFVPTATGTLPTTNGFQPTYGGDPFDGFVMKILPSGNGPADLSYATFLGGSGMDQALAI